MDTTIHLEKPVVIPSITFDRLVFPLIEIRTLNGKTSGTVIMDFATVDSNGKTIPLNKPQRIHLADVTAAAQDNPLLGVIASLLTSLLRQMSGMSLTPDPVDRFAQATVGLAADIFSQEPDSDL